jgi:hypothetical protein
MNPKQEIQLGLALARMRQHNIGAKNVTVAVKQVPFLWWLPPLTSPTDPIFNAPRILVPANVNRVAFSISVITLNPNVSIIAYYSFGYPAIQTAFVPPLMAGSKTFGFPIPGGSLVPGTGATPNTPQNGNIATDPIYVTLTAVAHNAVPPASSFSGYVLAYEGTLALESERNRPRAA